MINVELQCTSSLSLSLSLALSLSIITCVCVCVCVAATMIGDKTNTKETKKVAELEYMLICSVIFMFCSANPLPIHNYGVHGSCRNLPSVLHCMVTVLKIHLRFSAFANGEVTGVDLSVLHIFH